MTELLFFIKESIKLSIIKENIISNCNSIKISFEYFNKNFIITCIYRSPNDNICQFLVGLEMYVNSINNSYTSIICGDINIDILNNSLTSTEYLNIMSSKDFISCINTFTRVSNMSQSCIDHIFIKNIDTDYLNSYILKSDITDHYATLINIKHSTDFNDNTNIKLSEIGNKINTEHLSMLISIEDWDNILGNNDVNKAYESFNNTIYQLISLSSYNVTRSSKKHSKKKLKEWITQGLIVSIRHRNQLFIKLRKRPFDRDLKLLYTRYRNMLNILIKKAKILHYQKKKIIAAGNESKSIWGILNEVTGKKNNTYKKVYAAMIGYLIIKKTSVTFLIDFLSE